MRKIPSKTIFIRAFHDLLHKPVLAVPVLVVLMLTLVLFALLVLSALAVGGLSGGLSPDTIGSALLGAAGAMGVLLAISGIFSIFAFGMSVAMAAEYIETGSTSMESGWRICGERFMDFAVVSVVLGLLIGTGLILFVIPGVAVLFFFMFAFPALIVDNRSALESMKESLALVRHHISETIVFFAILAAMVLGVWLLNALLGHIPLLGPAVSLLLTSGFAAYAALAVVRAYAEMQGTFPGALPSDQQSPVEPATAVAGPVNPNSEEDETETEEDEREETN